MRPDLLRHRDLAWRVAAIVAATVAAALSAPTGVTAPLAVIALLGTADALVRSRRLGWADAVLVGTAGALVVLVLLGLLLDIVPGGLTRISWSIGAGLLALAAVVWRRRVPGDERQWARPSRRAVLRGLPWYVGAAGLLAVAIVISVHATDVANRAPVALSLVGEPAGGHANVQVSAGPRTAQYRLLIGDRSGSQIIGPFRLGAGDHVKYEIDVATGARTTVRLAEVGRRDVLRSLVVEPR